MKTDAFLDNPDQKLIEEIVGNQSIGLDSYYNPKTKEIVAILNYDQAYIDEDLLDLFSEDIEKVEKHKKDFIKFEVLGGFESFKIMERFLEHINDLPFREYVDNSLRKKKPFQNFKRAIDNSDYSQKWFDFRQNEMEKLVRERLESLK